MSKSKEVVQPQNNFDDEELFKVIYDEVNPTKRRQYGKTLSRKIWIAVRKYYAEKQTNFHIEDNNAIVANQNVYNTERFFDKD